MVHTSKQISSHSVRDKTEDKKQQELIKCGVDVMDTGNLCSENKLIKCVSECKKAHSGPIVDILSVRV